MINDSLMYAKFELEPIHRRYKDEGFGLIIEGPMCFKKQKKKLLTNSVICLN